MKLNTSLIKYMKLNTSLIKSIARAYGIEVDAKRQRIQGENAYKYCIWETNGTYIGGWYPSAHFAIVDGTTCRTVNDLVDAFAKYLCKEDN